MNKFFLNDFNFVTADENNARKQIAAVATTTKVFEVAKDAVFFLSYVSGDNVPEKEGKKTLCVFKKDTIENFNTGDHRLKYGLVNKDIFPEEIWEETEKTTGLIAIVNGEMCPVSALALATLTMRTSVGGEMTVSGNTLIRNLHLAEGWFSNPANTGKIQIVYRECEWNGCFFKKIYAFLGSQYSYVSQMILNDVLDYLNKDNSLGRADFKRLSMDHNYTKVVVEYPDVAQDIADALNICGADMVPFVSVLTSDIGWSSIIVRGGYRVNKSNSTIIVTEVKKQHKGNVTAEDLLKQADEEIFLAVRKFPEQLCELMGKSISTVNLASSIMMKVKKECFKHFSKKQMDFLKIMQNSLNPNLTYTGYDIAMMFIDGEEHFTDGCSKTQKDEYQLACAKVPGYLLKIL